jgi:hypothetical protein
VSDESHRKKVVDQDRPTPRPAFDPETFAREAESRLRMADHRSTKPTPRALQRPELPPLQWGRTGVALPGAPELPEQPGSLDALDALGADAVPVVAISREDLGWIEISPEASRLLTHVNGVRPLNVVCAMANVAPEHGATILLELADRGVVSFL